MTEGIPVVDPADLDPAEPVADLVVRTPFEVDDRRLELARIDDGDASGWFRRDGPTYGWVRAGRGRIEYGPTEDRSADLRPGVFLRVPAGTVHRYVARDGPLDLLAVVDAPTPAEPAESPDASAGPADPPTASTGGTDASRGTPAVVGPDDLVAAPGSANLVRETPFPGDHVHVLMMRVRAPGGAAAGWHHHGDNVYFGYAVDGPSETEYGPDGETVARIEVGECFHVPSGLVHRDTNPTDEAHTGVIWLCGGEPWVVNVDGPG